MAVVATEPSRPDLGRFLRSARALRCGELVLREEPLLRVPGGGSRASRASLRVPDVAAAAAAVRAAGLFQPSGDSAVALRLRTEALAGEGEDALLVRLALHFNSFAAGTAGRDQCVFATISLANHACKPTCIVDADEGTLRAVRDVAAGEVLTISYLDDAALLWRRSRRRAELAKRWEFTCDCARCAARLDDTRRFEACAVPSSAAPFSPPRPPYPTLHALQAFSSASVVTRLRQARRRR